MTYYTKSCPYCGYRYEIYEPKHISYGSPIQTCHHCGKSFIDKDFREIGVEGIRKIDKIPITPSSLIIIIIFVIFGIIATSLGIDENDSDEIKNGLFLFAIGVIILIVEIIKYYKRKKFFAEEEIASQKRLSDPEYAIALMQLGYNVPNEYYTTADELRFKIKQRIVSELRAAKLLDDGSWQCPVCSNKNVSTSKTCCKCGARVYFKQDGFARLPNEDNSSELAEMEKIINHMNEEKQKYDTNQ